MDFNCFRGAAVCAVVAIATAALAPAREWTNDEGRTIEADYVSADGRVVVLSIGGKQVEYQLSRLSEADREFVARKMEEVPAGGSAGTGWMRDHPIATPAFPDREAYLSGRNAKAVYKAFDTGNFPETWDRNQGDAAAEFSYENGRAIVYVPGRYDGSKPFGVYVHISPGDGGEGLDAYAPVMDELEMIYVSPKGTSNAQPMLRRVKLAVDALATVKAGWKVDPARVCVGGLSGGGHMAMLTHSMFPEMFVGSVSHAAQSYLPGDNSSGHFPGLTLRDLKSRDFKDHKRGSRGPEGSPRVAGDVASRRIKRWA